MKAMFFYDSQVGRLALAETEGKLSHLDFIDEAKGDEFYLPEDYAIKETKLIKDAKKELDQYFSGQRKEFTIPLVFIKGTDFQKRVWQALLEIPYGETRSYKEVAQMAGSPKACRAVGGANNKNPIAIIVPCHRVIGANGSMVGFGGGLDIKSKLLQVEKDAKGN